MLYQNEEDYVFDSSKIERVFEVAVTTQTVTAARHGQSDLLKAQIGRRPWSRLPPFSVNYHGPIFAWRLASLQIAVRCQEQVSVMTYYHFEPAPGISSARKAEMPDAFRWRKIDLAAARFEDSDDCAKDLQEPDKQLTSPE